MRWFWMMPIAAVCGVPAAFDVTIGPAGGPASSFPFCGSSYQAMRYLVLVLAEEIDSGFTINDLSFQCHRQGDHIAVLQLVEISMGLCETDQLCDTFDDNYIDGTRTMVFMEDPVTVVCDPFEWVDFPILDFDYDPSEGNLLIEVTWVESLDHRDFYAFGWDAAAPRALACTEAGAPSQPTGSLSNLLPRLQLSGLSQGVLRSMTFGGVKSAGWGQ